MDFLIFKSIVYTSYLCAKKQTKISCAENYQDGDKNLTKLSQAVISEALNFKVLSGSMPLAPSKLVPLALTNPNE